MNKIDTVKHIIRTTDGLIFSIHYIKQNGEKRILTGRTGVTAYLVDNPRKCKNGTSNTVAHIPKYLRVYDMHKNGYRTINLETTTYFKCGDVEIDFLK